MLRKIKLYGELAEFVGHKEFEVQVDSLQKAVSFLVNNFAGIEKYMNPRYYQVKVGDYAVDETETYMPAPIYYSHLILKELSKIRHSGKADFLGPDSKSQLSVEYDGAKPVGVKKIVVSTQHAENYDQGDLREFIITILISRKIFQSIGHLNLINL